MNVSKTLSLAKRLTAFRPVGDLDGALSETLVIDGQTLANLEILENASGEAQVCLTCLKHFIIINAFPFTERLVLDQCESKRIM